MLMFFLIEVTIAFILQGCLLRTSTIFSVKLDTRSTCERKKNPNSNGVYLVIIYVVSFLRKKGCCGYSLESPSPLGYAHSDRKQQRSQLNERNLHGQIKNQLVHVI